MNPGSEGEGGLGGFNVVTGSADGEWLDEKRLSGVGLGSSARSRELRGGKRPQEV